MKAVAVIGMGMSPEDLTARHLALIRQADILVGGKRLLEHFQDLPAHKEVLGKDLSGVVDFVKQRMKNKTIVVLASGDPLFFGIGARLVRSLGAENVLIYPNITSVAAAFARIKEPWSDVKFISLHGQKNENALFRALDKEDTVAVLTDPRNNPSWLARRLMAKGFANFKICVLEALGTPSERFKWYTLSEAAALPFNEPNLVVLKRSLGEPGVTPRLHLGMPDNGYEHEGGLITKAEIRAVTLCKLRLMPEHILWDLGAGSGSVAIEASLLVNRGRVIAVEQNPARIAQIRNNKKRFRVKNLDVVHGVVPDGLAELPQPDRIFVGGGGRDLPMILQAAARHLKPGGIIVTNTVLLSNIDAAGRKLQQLGFKTDMVQIQISRGQDMPWGERLEALNPIWIIRGLGKPEGARGEG
ncbi:MAG: precorrin-6y C5,15-methyltransferase (decarboxylating) subunit CbiE [Desulfobacterales bacterium]|nr:MAG: precorrin-6y C5,15-methyltransferase (decarboxylating) subunit CbiE [Desulfobacterales bacterium]